MNPEPIIKPGEIITWMGLAFETNDQVLLPRRETELLAGAALDLLKTVEARAPILETRRLARHGDRARSRASDRAPFLAHKAVREGAVLAR
jgi:hypothetical protein